MKRLGILFIAAIFGISLAVTSCSSGGDGEKAAETKTEVQKPIEEPEEVEPADPMEAMMARGEKIYKEKCIVCHQANGEGIPGAFPPLAKADYLLEDPIRGVEQTLNGSHEEMVVNGVSYNAPMPPQVDTKEDALAVINYVLNNFGNDAGYLTMEDIKDIEIAPR